MAFLAIAFVAILALGTLWPVDEAARITSVSLSNSIAYLPYLFAVWLATRGPETQQLRRTVLIAAILFRFIAFALPPALSDDVNRYRWEAQTISRGLNPYRVSPADLKETDNHIPGYDFSAVYGPVLEGTHWLIYQAGLPMKSSAAIAEIALLILTWRAGLPLWRWMLLGWSPLCVYEYWMNGHNDAWLLLLLYLAYSNRGWVAWLFLGLATLTKWWPVLLIPLWIRFSPSPMGFLIYASLLSSCLLLMPIGEWITKVRYTTGFMGGWENNPYLYRFLRNKMEALGICGTGSIAISFLRFQFAELVLLTVSLLLAFSANIHPWYLGWTLPFLALSRFHPLPWLLPMALLPIAYDPMIGWRLNGTWIEDPAIRIWIWSSVTLYSMYQIGTRATIQES